MLNGLTMLLGAVALSSSVYAAPPASVQDCATLSEFAASVMYARQNDVRRFYFELDLVSKLTKAEVDDEAIDTLLEFVDDLYMSDIPPGQEHTIVESTRLQVFANCMNPSGVANF